MDLYKMKTGGAQLNSGSGELRCSFAHLFRLFTALKKKISAKCTNTLRTYRISRLYFFLGCIFLFIYILCSYIEQSLLKVTIAIVAIKFESN